MASRTNAATLRRVNTIGKWCGLWVFLLTGSVVLGFDPETDGMEGIKAMVRKRFPEVRQLPTPELASWLADTNRPQPVLFDVRQPDEFVVSHLAGALQVNPDTKLDVLRAQLTTNRPVVVYCSVGYRSSELARRLLKAGITNVFNLEGSIFQWANEGRPVVNTNGIAAKVHPYNERWSTLLKPEVRGAGK